MENNHKISKFSFFVGMGCVITAAVLLLGNFMGESTFPTILGFLGVLFIGTSNYRLLK